jgi:hypothetical protein
VFVNLDLTYKCNVFGCGKKGPINVMSRLAHPPICQNPQEIATQLKIWGEKKKRGQTIESPPEAASKIFTRENQAKKMTLFFDKIIHESRF